MTKLPALAGALAFALATPSLAPAHRNPSSPPGWWLRQAMCIHHAETRGLADPAAWHDRRNPYSRGGMQFLYSTWRSVGGHGDPADASKDEQLWRAHTLWARDGGSWREWSTARGCGLA